MDHTLSSLSALSSQTSLPHVSAASSVVYRFSPPVLQSRHIYTTITVTPIGTVSTFIAAWLDFQATDRSIAPKLKRFILLTDTILPQTATSNCKYASTA